jgi:hypothetical protein
VTVKAMAATIASPDRKLILLICLFPPGFFHAVLTAEDLDRSKPRSSGGVAAKFWTATIVQQKQKRRP